MQTGGDLRGDSHPTGTGAGKPARGRFQTPGRDGMFYAGFGTSKIRRTYGGELS